MGYIVHTLRTMLPSKILIHWARELCVLCFCAILSMWITSLALGQWNHENIGLDNGLSPVRCQAISWTDADLLWSDPQGRLIFIEKLDLKMSCAMCQKSNERVWYISAEDCSDSIAKALELLQSCNNPSIYGTIFLHTVRVIFVFWCQQI